MRNKNKTKEQKEQKHYQMEVESYGLDDDDSMSICGQSIYKLCQLWSQEFLSYHVGKIMLSSDYIG